LSPLFNCTRTTRHVSMSLCHLVFARLILHFHVLRFVGWLMLPLT
jgi:hypothetical protein